jgi:alanine racemase
VLWGRELSVDVIAGHAGTISYELLCHAGNTANLI